MPDYRKLARQLIAAAGLAAVVLGPAALNIPTAGADPIPQRTDRPAAAKPAPLSIEMQVSPGGTQANVYVRPVNADLIAVSHSVRRVNGGGTIAPPTRIPLDDIRAPITGGVATTGGTPPPADYRKEHTIRLTGLQSNTTYEVTVNAGTPDGRTAVARQTFTTQPQRVSLTLDKIVVHDDGDGWLTGDGDVRWKWSVEGFSGGPLKDCYRKNSAGRCGFIDVSEGTVLPRTAAGQPFTYVFAQENFVAMDNTNAPPGSEDFTSMPTQFTIRADATEDDSFIIGPLDAALSTIFGDWGAWLSGSSTATWKAPQGMETASQQVTVAADDGTFRSTMYFTFRLFHDNLSYPPNDGRVHSSSK